MMPTVNETGEKSIFIRDEDSYQGFANQARFTTQTNTC